MDFFEVLDQVVALLRTRGRVTYRALKLQFQLDNDQLEALKEELIEAQELAVDKDGKMLVWKGEVEKGEAEKTDSVKRGKEVHESKLPSHQLPVSNLRSLAREIGGNSPCCFATSLARPRSPRSSTPKTYARW